MRGIKQTMFSFSDIPNLHSHTLLCKHAKGYPADYCKVAAKYSDIIGFSDHCPFPDKRYGLERMRFEELANYRKTVDDAKQQYPDMTILFGVEAEWCEDIGRSFYADTLMSEYQMDYLIGSAHYCQDKSGQIHHFFNYQPDIEVSQCFCNLTIKLIESGLFDFIAHPDAFMTPYNETTPDLEGMFKDIISAAVQYDIPLELNATGLRNKRTYPCRRFWEIAAEYPTLQTVVNADAHNPDHLFDQAVNTVLDMANELKLNICNHKVAQKIMRGKKK